VCDLAEESKNLAMENPSKTGLAGATTQTADVKGKLIEYAWKLQKDGYAESTIIGYSRILGALSERGANLYNQDSVKDVIAKQQKWSSGRKKNAVKAYTLFAQMENLSWEPPKYAFIRKLPFIPAEKEIDDLIAGCSKKMSCFLQLLKETGARRGEAFNLRWADVDMVTMTVRITPEKGSNPRIFRISENLARKLGCLLGGSEKVFDFKTVCNVDKNFRKQRRKIAHKLANPRLMQIHMHTFRHWKATMEYYRTKDILHVMRILGHRKIENTLIYVQLVEALFHEVDEEYVCKVAKNIEEAKPLIESGFEYVTGDYSDGGKLFRKKKALYLRS
jgi:integrase